MNPGIAAEQTGVVAHIQALLMNGGPVARDGNVRWSEISEPSKYRELNQAVEDMLKRAKPLPLFPDDLPGDEISLSIPVAFKLQ